MWMLIYMSRFYGQTGMSIVPSRRVGVCSAMMDPPSTRDLLNHLRKTNITSFKWRRCKALKKIVLEKILLRMKHLTNKVSI